MGNDVQELMVLGTRVVLPAARDETNVREHFESLVKELAPNVHAVLTATQYTLRVEGSTMVAARTDAQFG